MDLTQYLLACLSEECAEVQQMVGKCLRFGMDEVRRDDTRTNQERLSDELGDLFTLCEMLGEIGRKVWPDHNNYAAKKARKLKYMAYSIELGILNDLGVLNQCPNSPTASATDTMPCTLGGNSATPNTSPSLAQ